MSPDIWNRFEQQVRKRLTPIDASWRVEQVNGVIRALGPSPSPFDNSVCWARVDDTNADSVIRDQVSYFRDLGRAFMWKVYTGDAPADLEARLLRAGFEVQARVTLVILDTMRPLPAVRLPPEVELRRVEDPSGLVPAMDVQREVWKQDCQWLLDALTVEMKTQPDVLSVFVGWAGSRPVCSSWLRIEPGTSFASLWGGSVLADWRGRGLYRAMVDARAREARQRDVPYLFVEAGDMSRPILERIGFQVLSPVSKCVYREAQGP
ncbi:GNAT family N-acetyltransferase [Myxococcus stipitatus]|uniref:GNAT family N-acetyltransferase n=1 Tax=Myxococcus stipitatus TaxID=83455 RepID=UPI0030D21DE9